MPPQTQRRGPSAPAASSAPAPWIAGPRWTSEGLRQPGWLLLPLRGFLGLTFCYAGLQKLANPTYLDPHSPTSVVGQLHLLRHTSPIGPLLALSAHAPSLVGLLIAFGELAVGLGTLRGLWTRLAAVGGLLLSFTFFLTVSWSTTPYYYGSDIVFCFAWIVMIGVGAGNVLSADGWLRNRARTELRLKPAAAQVVIDAPRLRELCPKEAACGLHRDGHCARLSGCPVFPVTETLRPAVQEGLDRRTVLLGARAVGLVAVVATVGGGFTAAVGRLAGGTRNASRRSTLPAAKASTAPSTAPSAAPSAAASAAGTAITSAASVPSGQAFAFNDPASGQPAWLVHAPSGFVAYSAVCTHGGCTVNFDPSSQDFLCPCHGGVYDAHTGQVVAGPPPTPLPSIPVHVVGGQVRVD